MGQKVGDSWSDRALLLSPRSCSYSNGSSWKTSTSVRRSLLWKCTIPAGEAGEGIAVG